MKIRKEILKLKPYETSKLSGEINLDQNESPFPIPENIKQEIFERFNALELNRYPDENSIELKRTIAEYTGAKHAFLMTSATTALWICLKLLGIDRGDEVIVSDFSFPARSRPFSKVEAEARVWPF